MPIRKWTRPWRTLTSAIGLMGHRIMLVSLVRRYRFRLSSGNGCIWNSACVVWQLINEIDHQYYRSTVKRHRSDVRPFDSYRKVGENPAVSCHLWQLINQIEQVSKDTNQTSDRLIPTRKWEKLCRPIQEFTSANGRHNQARFPTGKGWSDVLSVPFDRWSKWSIMNLIDQLSNDTW